MSIEIDIIELKDFNNMVDNIIKDIDSGKIKSNPLAQQVSDIKTEEIVVRETATEEGETIKVEVKEISNKKSKSVTVKHANGEISKYDNAVQAAKAYNINPTTARKYCENNKVVGEYTWSYDDL